MYRWIFVLASICVCFASATLSAQKSQTQYGKAPNHADDSEFSDLDATLVRVFTRICGDKAIAHSVSQAFQKHLFPLFKDDTAGQSQIYRFVIDEFFKVANRHYELTIPIWHSEYQKLASYPRDELTNALRNFRRQIMQDFKSKLAPQARSLPRIKKRITIITGPYNGGHISPAKALKEALEMEFDIDIIDDHELLIDKLKEDIEAIDIEGNQNDEYSGDNVAFKEIDDDAVSLIRAKLTELKPDFIISTLHHIPALTPTISFMNIPMAVLITDFGFPYAQWNLVDRVNYPMASYWLPTKDRKLFRLMIQEFNTYSAFNWTEHARSHLIKQQLFEANLEFEALAPELSVFQFTGFPVAKIFETKISDTEKAQVLQQLKLNSDPERKNVVLSYGFGVNTDLMIAFLENLIDQQDALSSKIQLIILTGKNTELYHGLEDFLSAKGISIMNEANYEQSKARPFPEKILARVLPLLAYPSEIAALYKITDLLLSKAGGATTAEIVTTQTRYLRAFRLTEAELENIQYLEELGLSLPSKRFLKNADPLQEDLQFYFNAPNYDEFIESLNRMLTEGSQVQLAKALRFDRQAVRDLVYKTIEDYRNLSD